MNVLYTFRILTLQIAVVTVCVLYNFHNKQQSLFFWWGVGIL